MSKTHQTTASFRYALSGIKSSLINEPNIRVHFIVAFLTLLAAFFLTVTQVELAILILTIGLVITLELVNTAVEAVVDIVSPEIRPLAKVAKDVCAAAVLTSSATAFFVGLVILGPKVIDLIK